jgi:hypothetical protein
MWLFAEPCYEAFSLRSLVMRAVCAVILVTTLLTTSALADPRYGFLAPGKPAGVSHAQSTMTIGSVVLAGAVAFGALLAIQSGGAAVITVGTPVINASNAAARQAATLNTNH